MPPVSEASRLPLFEDQIPQLGHVMRPASKRDGAIRIDGQELLERMPFVAFIENAKGEGHLFQRALEGPGAIIGPVSALERVGVFLEPLKGVKLVEGDAGLEDIDEGESLVEDRALHDRLRSFDVPAEGPSDKADIHRDREGHRVKGLADDAGDLDRGLHPGTARRRRLPLGETVYHVVVHEHRNVRITPAGMKKVVSALTVHIAVPALGYHDEIGGHGLDRRSHRQGASMETVEETRVDILGHLGRLPDPRSHHEASPFDPKFP